MPALDRQPELDDYGLWVWNAYAELVKSRQFVMGAAQPIPLTEIMALAQLEELSGDDTREFLGYVRQLEDVYFEHLSNKAQNGGTGSHYRRARSKARRQRRN